MTLQKIQSENQILYLLKFLLTIERKNIRITNQEKKKRKKFCRQAVHKQIVAREVG